MFYVNSYHSFFEGLWALQSKIFELLLLCNQNFHAHKRILERETNNNNKLNFLRNNVYIFYLTLPNPYHGRNYSLYIEDPIKNV